MRHYSILIFLGLVAVGLPACSGPAPLPADLAITHVSVVDVENGRSLPGQTVLVAGNRIVAVGPSARTRVATGVQVVEARDKYLIPGLWDMHVHSSSDRITRETFLPLYVANGVTGVRDMKGDCFDPCDDLEPSIELVRQWQHEIAAATLVGPRIVASSPMIESPRTDQPSSVAAPATDAQARSLVRLMKDRGVDFIKVYSRLSREAFFALADEAAKQDVSFAGHVPVAVRASEVSDAGQRSIEHLHGILHYCSTREEELRSSLLDGGSGSAPGLVGSVLAQASETFGEAKCAALYERLVRNGTWLVPTLSVGLGVEWRDDPRLRYVSPEERQYWNERIAGYLAEIPLATHTILEASFRDITGAMYRAGVSILAGSDAGSPFVFLGFGLHDELELLVGAGLTAADALRAATLNPARFLEATDSLGTVEPGKLADLVLLDANPLDDIRNTQRINAVILDGRYFDRQALDQLLADVEAAASR